jgi:DNA repair exonuclease SbcCD ATPase subunit
VTACTTSSPEPEPEREREPEPERPAVRKVTSDWETPEPAPKKPAVREITSDWETVEPGERPRARRDSTADDFTMPPTQIGSADMPSVDPVPEVPDSGLLAAVKYLIKFVKALWQRRSAIRNLKELIKTDTASLDSVLGVLGREVRSLGVENRVLEAENRAIDEAEERKLTADREFSELQNKQAEENNRFAEIEGDRDEKVSEADAALEEAKNELGSLEAQRRGLRDTRKEIDRRLSGLIKNAETREAEAAKLEMGEQRQELRRAAEGLRRDAANLDPERQDLDRRLAALERPISKATATVEALKAELESARRSLNDAREGHRHRLSEIEAERGRKSRELAQADAEIQRRLVTLGTLVNLNRIKRPEFTELYARIDVLRGAIGQRTNEIDRLTVERGAYDRRTLIRGALVLGAAFLVMCLLLAIAVW